MANYINGKPPHAVLQAKDAYQINEVQKLDVFGSLRGEGVEMLLGSKIGVNMNVTTDQAIPIRSVNSKKYLITKIVVTNASIGLDTAVGGVYPAASKGGTAIVANSQAYSGLVAATDAVNLTLAVNKTYTLSQIFLSLTTAQGAAATADVYVFGIVL